MTSSWMGHPWLWLRCSRLEDAGFRIELIETSYIEEKQVLRSAYPTDEERQWGPKRLR